MSKPHDSTILDIERTLLATLMLRPGDCFRVNVSPEYFVSELHADLFAAIRSLSSEGKPADPVSIADHFEQQGRRELGALAVTVAHEALLTAVPDAFAHRVTTAWRQRRAREIGMGLVESTDERAVDQAIAALMNLHATEQNHEWDAKEATRAAFQELTVIHESGGKLPGVTTGLKDLDDKLGGLHNGDMIVVGARAAMGKTAMLGGMARCAAEAGIPVGVISGEQPVEQLTLRTFSALSNVDAKKFRTAQFDEAEWTRVYGAIAKAGGLPMWFLDRSAPTLAEVVRVARRWKHKHGIKALYVDYLQRITGEGERKHEQVGFVARGLKNLARDLDIPVVVLAQVSRAVEGRTNQSPRMGDLSDSSEIEKEADQVLMLFRPGYYDENEDQSVAKVIVEKNRHGPTGYVDVRWHGGTMVFGDLDHRYDEAFGG
ncbi:AAA family ATPase [Dyella halodurans]|uniref:DNA 5'-3' helicase n=1 Tax=Dyella halodurans TaxID=1920171 RepID=A0ABV9C083_9GAMM|nr:DnaB-like helicase C-terminal domain-containing protein [Dyella halodurans]